MRVFVTQTKIPVYCFECTGMQWRACKLQPATLFASDLCCTGATQHT